MLTRLTIDQAAAALGVSRATVRRRLRNGQLSGERRQTPQGFVWELLVDSPTDSASDGPPTPHPDEGARLRDEHIADLRRRVEDQSREIAELHRLLAQAQQHLLTAAAADSPATPQTENGAGPHGEDRRRWWQRLWWG